MIQQHAQQRGCVFEATRASQRPSAPGRFLPTIGQDPLYGFPIFLKPSEFLFPINIAVEFVHRAAPPSAIGDGKSVAQQVNFILALMVEYLPGSWGVLLED